MSEIENTLPVSISTVTILEFSRLITQQLTSMSVSFLTPTSVFVTNSKKWRKAYFKCKFTDVVNWIQSHFKTQRHNFAICDIQYVGSLFFSLALSYWAFHLALSKLYTSPGCNICPWWHQTCFTLSGCSFEVLSSQETGEMNNMLSGVSHPLYLDTKVLISLLGRKQRRCQLWATGVYERVISEVHLSHRNERKKKKLKGKSNYRQHGEEMLCVSLQIKTHTGQKVKTHTVKTFIVHQPETSICSSMVAEFAAVSVPASLWFTLPIVFSF